LKFPAGIIPKPLFWVEATTLPIPHPNPHVEKPAVSKPPLLIYNVIAICFIMPPLRRVPTAVTEQTNPLTLTSCWCVRNAGKFNRTNARPNRPQHFIMFYWLQNK